MRANHPATSADPLGIVRYTLKTVKRVLLILSLALNAVSTVVAADASFSRIRVPDEKGKQVKAVLTFSDQDHAVQIQPVKGKGVVIPYREIYKFSYEYTRHHRINEGTIITAPLGIGAIAMLTKSRSHWLEIDYDEANIRKAYVLRMDRHEYLRILDAVKTHTGKDAEILGNADKRKK